MEPLWHLLSKRADERMECGVSHPRARGTFTLARVTCPRCIYVHEGIEQPDLTGVRQRRTSWLARFIGWFKS
jgi:hypothetical protein